MNDAFIGKRARSRELVGKGEGTTVKARVPQICSAGDGTCTGMRDGSGPSPFDAIIHGDADSLWREKGRVSDGNIGSNCGSSCSQGDKPQTSQSKEHRQTRLFKQVIEFHFFAVSGHTSPFKGV